MMRISKWVALSIVAWTAGASCLAQQKFPLRPGEWTLTTPGLDPMLFCLNDEMWQKALTQNPVCTIQELKVTSGGITYSMNCPAKSFQMKGTVTMTFDGMEHMIGKALIDMTVNGKTTSTPTSQDYRWKSSKCSADDMNMHAK
jgi:Protein of unknown function (DUF3617)